MNELRLRAIICLGGMIIFYAIPIAKSLLGEQFTIVQSMLSVGLGLAFGIYGLIIYDRTEKFDKLKEKIESEDTDDIIVLKLTEQCPKCNGVMNTISRQDGKLMFDKYSGLVYCLKCDFEISKEDFDKGVRE